MTSTVTLEWSGRYSLPYSLLYQLQCGPFGIVTRVCECQGPGRRGRRPVETTWAVAWLGTRDNGRLSADCLDL